MDGMTIGVEEEFQIVERESGALAPRSNELVPIARQAVTGLVTGELNRCQIETATSICSDLDELDAQLRATRRELDRAAAEIGCGILPVATHPWSGWQDQAVEVDRERFREMEDRYQVVAREQVICGCHVHVGVSDPDLVVAAMTACREWLPVLLALFANSPFWEGADSGYDSFRHEVWARWPTAGVPPALEGRADYAEVVDDLRAAGAIEDATHLYWYLRPSEAHPTLEVRVADVCLTVDETVALAGLARALVLTGMRHVEQGLTAADAVSDAVLTGALWQAARYGLSDRLVSPVSARPVPAGEAVNELLDHVGRALDERDDGERVRAVVHRTLAEGNGATRQRRVAEEAGDLRSVVTRAHQQLLAPEMRPHAH
jgi:glutamate---cysteine ligase / carboxylate-amine ligase